jgi:putative oxidoreductase
MTRVMFAIRLLLGAVFLYSGLIKASASAQFAVALLPFSFIPETWNRSLSFLLPVCEIAGGVLIVDPWTKKIGALIVLGLCPVFLTALSWAFASGIVVSCSCFGQEEPPSLTSMSFALLRDMVLGALALLVILKDGSHSSRISDG